MFRFVYCVVLNVNNHFTCLIELSTRDLIGQCSDWLVLIRGLFFVFFIIMIRPDPMFAFRVWFLGLLGVSFGCSWGSARGQLLVHLS